MLKHVIKNQTKLTFTLLRHNFATKGFIMHYLPDQKYILPEGILNKPQI